MAEPDSDTKFYIEEKNKEERNESDGRYAIKLVERVVFTIVAAVSLSVLYLLLKNVGMTPPGL